jgi:hypothetical protein
LSRLLQAANAHRRQQQGPDRKSFEWRFVSPDGEPIPGSNGMHIETEPASGFSG